MPNVACAVCLVVLLCAGGPAPAAETPAVVDRIVDDRAVLLVEHADGDEERIEPVEHLPPPGRHEGAVLRSVSYSDRYVYDRTATQERKRSARRRFERLSSPWCDTVTASGACADGLSPG